VIVLGLDTATTIASIALVDASGAEIGRAHV